MKSIYLDYAAGTPLAPEVVEAIRQYESDFYNPSAIYLSAKKASGIIDESRKTVADILGAKTSEIIFTSGSTEANNLAIGGVLKRYPKGRAAVAATEHKAVLQAAKHFASGMDIIPVDERGLVTPEALKAAIEADTALISIAMADSEIGATQQFRKLLPVIKQARQARGKSALPLYFHSDASQAASYLDLHVDRLGVDLLSLGGSKIYGPKSTGVLYAKHNVNIEPLAYGGGQERGLRSGTENTASIAGFSRALALAQSLRASESRRLSRLRDKLAEELAKASQIVINGDHRHQLPNFLNISVDGADGERLVMKLDELGLMSGTGAACSIRDDQPSYVLKAIKLSNTQAGGSLRLSLGRGTTEAEINTAAKLILQVIAS
ncbi:MAG TPA: cysteine desulfurase family protein [Candidatus Saccharimonadales bacterium]